MYDYVDFSFFKRNVSLFFFSVHMEGGAYIPDATDIVFIGILFALIIIVFRRVSSKSSYQQQHNDKFDNKRK